MPLIAYMTLALQVYDPLHACACTAQMSLTCRTELWGAHYDADTHRPKVNSHHAPVKVNKLAESFLSTNVPCKLERLVHDSCCSHARFCMSLTLTAMRSQRVVASARASRSIVGRTPDG